MSDFPILSVVIFLPFVGVLFLLFIRSEEKEAVARNCRNVALLTSVFTFLASLFLWINFKNGTADFQFVEQLKWMPEYKISYHVGLDGISLWFVMLTTLLTPIAIGVSWDAIQSRVKEYMIAFLALETMMIGMFSSLDIVLFYIFFEAVLIPMFLIIGVWGGPHRVYAAFKFFLYTLLGSVLMLLAIFAMYYATLASGQFVEAGKVVAQGPTEAIMSRVDLHPFTGQRDTGGILTARVVAHDEFYQLTELALDGQTLKVAKIAQLLFGSGPRLRHRVY